MPTDYFAMTINDLIAAVEAIETELGILPSGAYANVRSRLDILETRGPSGSTGFSANGDLSGNNLFQTVVGIQNNPVPAPSAAGTVLTWNGTTLNWSLGGGFTAAGDLSGTSSNQTVIGIQGVPVVSTAPTTGQVLEYNGTHYVPTTPSSGFTAGHDLSGTPTSQTVIGIQGNPVPAPTGTDTVLTWTGSALAWDAASGGGNVFVYREGGVAAGNVYTSFAAALAARSAIQGFAVIQFDNSITSLNIPAGTYAIPDGTLFYGTLDAQGSGGEGPPTINVADNVFFNPPPTMFEQVQFLTNNSTTANVTVNGLLYVTLRNASIQTSGGAAPLYATATSSSSQIQFFFWDSSNMNPGAGAIVNVDSSSQIAFNLFANSILYTGAIAGTGTVNASYDDSSQVQAQGGFSGTLNTTLLSQAISVNYSPAVPGNWSPVPTQVSSALDQLAARSVGSGITQLTGDVTAGPGSGSVAATVVNIHGASVPAAGSLTTGNVLQVTGTSALSYAAVNLAGGANFVTGTLPAGNQAAQTMGGDVTGTTAASTVAKIQGQTVTSGALVKGDLFIATTTSNWAGTVVTGDVSFSTATPGLTTVLAINGTTVPATPTANQVLIASSGTAATWATIVNANVSTSAAIAVSKLAAGTSAQVLLNSSTPTPTWTTLSADVTISSTGATTVNSVQGVVISGTPSNGYVLEATSSTAASWQPNSGGSGITQLTGDVTAGPGSGSVAAMVARINGATVPAAGGLTTGNGLYVTGASALSYSALNLAGGANYVTGNLPVSNVAPGTSAQVLMSNGTPATTWTTLSGDMTVSATGTTTVAKVNGTSVPATPSANQVLVATSGTAATWETIADAQITAGGISNVSISATAAIAGSKISPSFGAQNISTTGTLSVGATTVASLNLNVKTVTTATYTIDTSEPDFFIYCNRSGTITLTLPAPTAGRYLIVKDISGAAGTNNITINPHASETIDGGSSATINLNYGSLGFSSDGTSWYLS